MRKWIPSMLTLSNLLFGFLSILFVFKEELPLAVLFILLGLFFDFFDGYCARKLDAASEVGKELDSLADLVTFGIAPAALVYAASLHEVRVFGAACCLVYVCCCALRLARFNASQSGLPGFVGMPTPFAAVSALLLSAAFSAPAASIVLLLLGALMVSRISFPSFKKTKPEPAEDC